MGYSGIRSLARNPSVTGKSYRWQGTLQSRITAGAPYSLPSRCRLSAPLRNRVSEEPTPARRARHPRCPFLAARCGPHSVTKCPLWPIPGGHGRAADWLRATAATHDDGLTVRSAPLQADASTRQPGGREGGCGALDRRVPWPGFGDRGPAPLALVDGYFRGS